MKIKIAALDDEFFTIEVIVSSVSYSETTGKFLMAAGGYDIAGTELPKPNKSVVLGNMQEFSFATSEQALQFFDWIRKANISARDSFTRMLD